MSNVWKNNSAFSKQEKKTLHLKHFLKKQPQPSDLSIKTRSAMFFGEKAALLSYKTIRVERLTFGRPNKAQQKAH